MKNDQFDFTLRMAKGHDTKITSYEDGKKNHSLLAVITWVVYGLYSLFTGRMSGLIIVVLYFFVGIFIASFASILTYLPVYFIDKYHDKHHSTILGVLTIVFTPVTLIGTVIWIIFLANTILKYVHHI
jgi:uncharacterized membrane protein HdeD (DUF308 family)